MAVGIIQSVLSLFNLESPAMQTGEDVFIWEMHRSPGVWLSGMESTEQAAGAVQGDLQPCELRGAQPAEQAVLRAVLCPRELTAPAVCLEHLSSHVSEKCNALPGSSKLKVRKVPSGQQ